MKAQRWMKEAGRAPRWSPFEAAVGAMLALAIIGCGGPWGIGDVALSVFALFLVVWAFVRQLNGPLHSEWLDNAQLRHRTARWRRSEWLSLAAFAVLVLSQWLPLPMALWQWLPGRLALARDLAVAGVTPAWMPLGLDRLGAFRGLAALLPAVALFVSVRCLPDLALRRLLGVAIALGVLSVLLGLLQVAGGGDTGWRMHDFHNRTGALGFFANRNHQAAFLVMLLPVAIALSAADHPARSSRFWRTLLLSSVPLLILGIALTYSRAGIALGTVALVASLLFARRHSRADRRRPWGMLVLAAIGLVLVMQFALSGLMPRFAQDALHDSRWDIFAATVDSGRDYQPLGAGLGSYAQAMQASEPNRNLVDAWLNHAHNDWLEVWLELGVGGVTALLVLAGSCLLAAGRAWRGEGPMALLARAASLSILLVALHSLVDWPLRTGANLLVLTLLVATLLRGATVLADRPAWHMQETNDR